MIKQQKLNDKSIYKKFELSNKFILVGLSILLLPALLTQLPWALFDFTETGEIGDTIGGITAPFVSLLGAYLVYQAFNAQLQANVIQSEANQIQRKAAEFDVALKLIDDLSNKLSSNVNKHENLVDVELPDVENCNFYEIISFWPIMKTYRRNYMTRIIIVIRQVRYLVKYIEQSNVLKPEDKDRLFERTVLLIGSDLMSAFKTLLTTSTDWNSWPEDEQAFIKMCQKFKDKTLDALLFYLVDLEDFQQ